MNELLTIDFYSRDLSATQTVGTDFAVESMTWGEGGEIEAKLTATCGDNDLWGLVDLLRFGVKIRFSGGTVWQGFVRGAQLRFSNGLRLSYSLEKMGNRVRVQYAKLDPASEYAGESTWTDWASDTDSIDAYGTKELQLRMSQEATQEQAEAYRARGLAEYALPLSDRDLGNIGVVQEPQGTLYLAGWYETLDWKSYSEDAGKESYEDIGTGLQAFGDAAATTKVAQSIQLGSSRGWSADQIAVRVKKEGSPTDDLTVELCADGTSAPGAVLASAILAGASVPEHLNWVTLTLNTRVSLALSTTYWIVVRRSGANDGTNYYKTDGNESLGYTRGSFKIWNGSAWVARGTDADMLFQILGVLETTQQIADIVSDCGQFLAGSYIDDASGVYSTPYRDGTKSGLQCIKELLRSGTTNGRRLRATVSDDLTVWIDEEPAAGSEDYIMLEDGTVTDELNNPLVFPPVQAWIRIDNLLPISASAYLVADPTRAFIEQATWVKNGAPKFRLRGMGFGVG